MILNKKRKICVVITARPSYSRIKTALLSIKEKQELELQIVIASSALIPRYGSIINYLEDDGFNNINFVYNVLEGESLTSMAKTTGLGIIELSTVFENITPDIVVTIADRFETMATAVTASFMNIPLAHVQGGEVTGNIDEKVRHSITKLSDYHFVSSEDSYNRLLKLGEDARFIYNVGCPSIDLAKIAKNNPKIEFDIYEKYLGVGCKPNYDLGYWVVMQHPVTTEIELSKKHIEETLYAMRELNETVFWFWPNIDAGSDVTSNRIRAFREKFKLKNFHFFKGMEPIDFLRILINSNGLIGNSSVGIRECAFLGIPAINIGNRQSGRMRGANVIDIDYNKIDILKAVQKIKLKNHIMSSNIYGQGDTGNKIAEIIEKVPLTIKKQITY